MDNIDGFLSRFQDGKQEGEHKDMWLELIRPTTVSLILGSKGAGKSGLGYLLLDKLSKAYSLMPIVVNQPREKQNL